MAKKNKKMDSGTLKGILASERESAMASTHSTKLTQDRLDALDYYNGDMSRTLPVAVGRSSAVSTDVADTIEGMLPQLMDIFAGSEKFLRFDPVGPNDVAAAEQETDYVNHCFQKYGGWLTLYTFIKDALLSKTGVVKVSWREEEKEQRETYLDQDDQTFQILVSDPNAEVVAHAMRDAPGYMPDPMNPDAMPPQLHDVTIAMKETYGHACCEPVPPEEFGITRNARSVKDAGYCFHTVQRSESDLIEQGYDDEQLGKLPSYNATAGAGGQERYARDTVDESRFGASGELSDANRMIEVTEHYVKLDYEGDGVARLYRVTTGGHDGEILMRDGEEDIVEQDFMPFAAMTPVIVTHRFYGHSVADLVMDIQRIKTALLRALLDNAYLANNPRTEISESHASENTIDDLLVSRPGGVVRTKMPGGLNTLTTPPIGGHVFPLIQYMDSTREARTGMSMQSQGLNADALQNQSATAVAQTFSASQARMKLIARVFAETGIKDMFALLHAVIRKNGSRAETIRLRDTWVQVDPREWRERSDMTINVGLGSGNKSERLQAAMMIVSMQKDALVNGLTNLVTAQNLYNSAKHLVALTDQKDVSEFFTDPSTQPPPEEKPDPKMLELQAKNEIEKTQAQADIASQDRKIASEIALAEKHFQFNSQLKREEHDQKMELARAQGFNKHLAAITQRPPSMGPDGTMVHHPAPVTDGIAEMIQELTRTVRGANAPKKIVRNASGQVSHVEGPQQPQVEPQADPNAVLHELVAELRRMNGPKRVVRGYDGKATHVAPVNG